MNHGMAIWAKNREIGSRVDLFWLLELRDRLKVMNVYKILSQDSIFLLKVNAASLARNSMDLDRLRSILRIALIKGHISKSFLSFDVRFEFL